MSDITEKQDEKLENQNTTPEPKPEPQVDVEALLKKQKEEMLADFDKKLEEERNKSTKLLEDTLLEIANKKEDTSENAIPDKSEKDESNEFLEVIKRIDEKRKQEEERIKIEKKEQAEREKDEKIKEQAKELDFLRLKDKLNEVKKQEPYLADVIDEELEAGRITNVEQVDLILSPTLKEKLKEAYVFNQAVIESGGDPRAHLANSNIMNSDAQAQERRQKAIEAKMKKYRQ